MSSSDLYILNGKSTKHLAEFRNGWGSGPRAWGHLAAKYIPEKPVFSLSESHMKKVWALATHHHVRHHEKVVLMMTFDKAYVPLAHLENAADCCIRFAKECENGSSENHWHEIGESLKLASTMKMNRHARGVALSCTSVNDCWGWPSKEWLEEAWSIYAEGSA